MMTARQAPRYWYAPIDGVEVYVGDRRADLLPADHPLVDQRLSCEESAELIKEAGERTFRIDWVETGFMAACSGGTDEHDLEPQFYCVMHFGGRGDVYPTMDPHFLLS